MRNVEPHGTCPIHGPYFDNYGWNGTHKCEKCKKAAQALTAPLREDYDRALRRWEGWQQQMPPRHANRTLANWRPEGKAQEAVIAMVKAYAADVAARTADGRGLVLLGPPGVGKTHLLCGIVSAAWAQGVRAEYHVWPQVLTAVKDSFGGERDHPARGLLDDLAAAPLLALDELAVRAGSEYDQEALFNLIDYRYQTLKPTVCASNATQKTLPMIGERAVDRMKENMAFIQINGESRRDKVATDKALATSPPALVKPEPVSLEVQTCVNGEMVTKTWIYPQQEGVG